MTERRCSVPDYLGSLPRYRSITTYYFGVRRDWDVEIGERMLKLIDPEQRLRDVGAGKKISPGLPSLECCSPSLELKGPSFRGVNPVLPFGLAAFCNSLSLIYCVEQAGGVDRQGRPLPLCSGNGTRVSLFSGSASARPRTPIAPEAIAYRVLHAWVPTVPTCLPKYLGR